VQQNFFIIVSALKLTCFKSWVIETIHGVDLKRLGTVDVEGKFKYQLWDFENSAMCNKRLDVWVSAWAMKERRQGKCLSVLWTKWKKRLEFDILRLWDSDFAICNKRSRGRIRIRSEIVEWRREENASSELQYYSKMWDIEDFAICNKTFKRDEIERDMEMRMRIGMGGRMTVYLEVLCKFWHKCDLQQSFLRMRTDP